MLLYPSALDIRIPSVVALAPYENVLLSVFAPKDNYHPAALLLVEFADELLEFRQRRVRDFMVPIDEADENTRFDPEINETFLKPSWTLEYALRTFDTGGHQSLPVVDEKDESRIIAWAQQTAALRHFNAALVQAAEEEHAH